MAKKPNEQQVTAVLRDVLFNPLCPSDRVVITQRIQSQPSEVTRGLLEKYDIKSIAKVAHRLVEKRHCEDSIARKKQKQDQKEITKSLLVQAEDGVGSVNAEKGPSHAAQTANHDSVKSSRETQSDQQYVTNVRDMKTVPPESEQVPYAVQHVIYVRLQTYLERVCYEFTARTMPHILEENGWSCSEALELNVWAGVMRKNGISVRTSCTGIAKESLDELFASLIAIRHATVHRERLSVATIKHHLAAAESLRSILGEESDENDIAELQRMVSSAIENQSNFLSRNAAIVKEYDEQRAESLRQYETATKDLNYQQRRRQQTLNDQFQQMVQCGQQPAPNYCRSSSLLKRSLLLARALTNRAWACSVGFLTIFRRGRLASNENRLE